MGMSITNQMLMTDTNKQHLLWIDVAKLIAIMGVLVDHTAGFLYTNERIQLTSFYSVSLFVLITGYTQYASIDAKIDGRIDFLWRFFCGRVKHILPPYAFAVLIYHVDAGKSFDLEKYLHLFIHFNASGPLYYVLLYIQLSFLSVLIYSLMNRTYRIIKGNNVSEFVLFIVLLLVSALTTNFTNILGIYGGGGRLLGGTYLVLLYIGMYIKKHRFFDYQRSNKQYAAGAALASVVCVAWLFLLWDYRECIDNILPFGRGLNPPGIVIMVYGMIVFVGCYYYCSLLCLCNFGRVILSAAGFLGRHTLYIFLFHLFFRTHPFRGRVVGNSIHLTRFVYMSLMIVGPILVEYIIRSVIVFLKDTLSVTKCMGDGSV